MFRIICLVGGLLSINLAFRITSNKYFCQIKNEMQDIKVELEDSGYIWRIYHSQHREIRKAGWKSCFQETGQRINRNLKSNKVNVFHFVRLLNSIEKTVSSHSQIKFNSV